MSVGCRYFTHLRPYSLHLCGSSVAPLGRVGAVVVAAAFLCYGRCALEAAVFVCVVVGDSAAGCCRRCSQLSFICCYCCCSCIFPSLSKACAGAAATPGTGARQERRARREVSECRTRVGLSRMIPLWLVPGLRSFCAQGYRRCERVVVHSAAAAACDVIIRLTANRHAHAWVCFVLDSAVSAVWTQILFATF